MPTQSINWPEIGVLIGLLTPIGAAFVFIVNTLIETRFNRFMEKLDERYANREVTDIRIKAVERALDLDSPVKRSGD
jgi:hypothetical protein